MRGPVKRTLVAGRSRDHGTVLVVVDDPLLWYLAAEFAGRFLLNRAWTYPLGNRICVAGFDRERVVAEIPCAAEVLRELCPKSMEWVDLMAEVDAELAAEPTS